MRFTFQKSERLCSGKAIDEVFSKGKELRKFPFLLKYLVVENREETSLQIAISVPKRKVKHAVDRNRLKRQIRESYRLNNSDIKLYVQQKDICVKLFLIYSGKEKEDFHFLEEKIKLILKELIAKL